MGENYIPIGQFGLQPIFHPQTPMVVEAYGEQSVQPLRDVMPSGMWSRLGIKFRIKGVWIPHQSDEECRALCEDFGLI